MIVVYPVRQPPDSTNFEDLRYSLRSLSNIDYTGVVICGYAPPWVDRSQVTVIETDQSGPISEKWVRIGRNLKAGIAAVGEGRFLWMNQDVFFVRRAESIPPKARGLSMQRFSDSLRISKSDEEHNGYVSGLRSQTAICRTWGVNVMTAPCLDSHHPLPMRAELAAAMIERVESEYPEHPVGHFKNLYVAYIDERILSQSDPKINGSEQVKRDARLISTSPNTWKGRAGQLIRSRFRTPSPYELKR